MPVGTGTSTGVAMAYADLVAAARAVVRTWFAVLLVVISFVVLAACLVVSTFLLVGPLYVPVPLMLLAGTAYNVTRFIPKTPVPRGPRLVLQSREVAALLPVLTARTPDWMPRAVVLTAEPSIWINPSGQLEVGQALLTCLGRDDLAALVEEAHARHAVASEPSVAKALKIARGQVGRWIRDDGPQWASRLLLAHLDLRVAALARAHEEWLEAHLAQVSAETAGAIRSLGVVEEGWWHLASTFLLPALEMGYRHEEPFTGLHAFLAAAKDQELVDAQFLAPIPLAVELGIAHHERALSPSFGVDEAGLDPLDWSQHADAISVPAWRGQVARGVADMQRAMGEPRPTTLRTIVEMLEGGWAEAVAAVMADSAPDSADDAGVDTGLLRPLVAAAIALSVLETSGARVRWRWPFGPEVDTAEGITVLHEAAAQAVLDEVSDAGACAAVRSWLSDLSVDIDAPLWLDGGAAPASDALVGAFVASRKLTRASVTVVVSRAAVRIIDLRYAEALVRDLGMRMSGPAAVLDPVIEAAARGEIQGEQVVPTPEVVAAELRSIVGGMFWRLRIRTPDDRITLFGSVRAQDVAHYLTPALGDRLTTVRVFLPRQLGVARYAFAVAGVGLGGTLLGCGVLAPAMGASMADGAAVAVLGAGAVMLALLPDALDTWVRRAVGGRRAHDVHDLPSID